MLRPSPPIRRRLGYFQLLFGSVLIQDGAVPIFTGYPTVEFRYPLYKLPPEVQESQPWLDRCAILTCGVMDNRGLEITWVDDPVELFFLQSQGSGRIILRDGQSLHVGYGGANGHLHRSIGVELVRQGDLLGALGQCAGHPKLGVAEPGCGRRAAFSQPILRVFPRIALSKRSLGPHGAMNRPITPFRTIAVAPAYVSLGALVWIEKDGRARCVG